MTRHSRLAMLLAAGALLAGASRNPLDAQATRKGWWIEIKSTEARSITILVGAADTSVRQTSTDDARQCR